eukprot:1116315-Prorocentrum_lima.AAC.1
MIQQEDHEVRKEELYLPKATQDAVEKSSRHGFDNPAAGGLKKSTPVTYGGCSFKAVHVTY